MSVVGVSFDDPGENARFAHENGFPFPLLSDLDHRFAFAVGAAASLSQSHARRISYLVGADGRILRAYGEVNPATHAEDVLRDLDRLGMSSSPPAEGAGAGREPDEPSKKPLPPPGR